jgi:hypothetical protein
VDDVFDVLAALSADFDALESEDFESLDFGSVDFGSLLFDSAVVDSPLDASDLLPPSGPPLR